MTDFEAFDTVSQHLLSQKKMSIRETDYGLECAYRGDNGLKCAIGCLIPDELYNEKMEGISIHGLARKFPSLGKIFRDVNMDMLLELQGVHDDTPVERWGERLGYVFKRFLSNDKNGVQ